MHLVRPFKNVKDLVIILLFLTSCIPQKRLIILQDKDKSKTNEYSNQRFIIRIKPGDNLHVAVSGLDEKTAEIFNMQTRNTTSTQGYGGGGERYGSYVQTPGMYMSSYTVNDSGYIIFPVIKKIYIKGLTMREAQKIIQDSINQYANFTTAIVKFVSFQVTILGEVKRPGAIFVSDEQFDILEAFGLCGDFEDYANKNKVTIVRRTDKGNIIKYLDLTDKKILESEYYYLRPNDIIYVPPLTAKTFGLRTFQLPTYLSWFSSIVSAFLLFNFLK